MSFGGVLNLDSFDVVISGVFLGIIIVLVVNFGILVAIVGGYYSYHSNQC